MQVVLGQFNKRLNSTKRPVWGDIRRKAILTCYILDDTSLLNPVITIEQTGSTSNDNIRSYNYAYLADFGDRCYFIDDIRSEKGLWIVSLTVDVLATYRSSILNSTQYVVRSASNANDNIVDKMYITKPFATAQRSAVSALDTGYVMRNIGTYSDPMEGQVFYFNYEGRVPDYAVCFGIIGSNGVGANYYVATESNFIQFMTNVFALVPSDMGNLADGLKKMLLDLNQYIISVVRLPVMPHTNNMSIHMTQVKLGSYNVNCDCYAILPGVNYEEYWFVNGLDLPQHPNITTHNYFAMPPFTSYALDFLPIGTVPLDAARLFGVSSINVRWRIDYISGLAWFRVGYDQGVNFVTLSTHIAQVGIPIPLSQLKVDTATGVGLSIANVLSDAFKNDFGIGNLPKFSSAGANPKSAGKSLSEVTAGRKHVATHPITETSSGTPTFGSIIGNLFDANTNVLDQIIDYAGSILGDVYTQGSTGSYLNIVAGVPQVRGFFIDQAENDIPRFGRPLYSKRQLSTLSGFCVCKNANITEFGDVSYSSYSSPTPAEVNGINNLLNSGIYIE